MEILQINVSEKGARHTLLSGILEIHAHNCPSLSKQAKETSIARIYQDREIHRHAMTRIASI